MRLFLAGIALVLGFTVNSYELNLGMSLGLSIYFILYDILKRGIQFINPLNAYLFFNCIGLVGTFLTIDKIDEPGMSYYFPYGKSDYLVEMSQIYLLFTVLFWAGFYMKSFKSKAISIHISINSLLLFLVSMFLSYAKFQYPLISYGTIGSLIYLIPLFSILYFLRMHYLQRDNLLRFYAIILLIFLTVINVFYAYLRSEMVLPLFVFVLGSIIGKNDFKFLRSFSFLAVVLVVVYLNQYFAVYGQNRAKLSIGSERVSELVEIKGEDELGKRDYVGDYSSVYRASNINQLTAIVNLTKKKGPYLGKTLEPLLVALIPRIIWKEKPKIAQGVWFALEIGEARKRGNWYSTSINMSIPGELYLNYLFTGLIIGSLLTGLFFRFLWDSCNFWDPKNVLGTFFGGYILYIAFFGLGSDLQIFVSLTAMLLVFYILKLFIKYATNQNFVYRRGVERK